MDLFTDGAHVRLRRGIRGMVLSADGDWSGVSVLPHKRVAFLSSVWRVRHHRMGDNTFLLLQGAYGRYLAVSPPPLQAPLRPVQRYIDDDGAVIEDALWRPVRVKRESDVIRLRNFNGYLQASKGAAIVSQCFTDTERQRTRWTVEVVEAASAPPRPLVPHTVDPAMELFPDKSFVQLRCLGRAGRQYLFADPDSRVVSLGACDGRVPFEARVWRVHHWRRDSGTSLLMLQGAYGGYLGAVSGPEGTWRLTQCSFDAEGSHHLMWLPVEVSTGVGGIVRLRNLIYGYFRPSEALMSWEVKLIPASLKRPPLPPADESGEENFQETFVPEKEPMLQRTISFLRADTEGNHGNKWKELLFKGCSLTNLIAQMEEIMDYKGIILCVHSGCFARLAPLVKNLPRNNDKMDIVVLQGTSPAASRFKYPIEGDGTDSVSPAASRLKFPMEDDEDDEPSPDQEANSWVLYQNLPVVLPKIPGAQNLVYPDIP